MDPEVALKVAMLVPRREGEDKRDYLVPTPASVAGT
jgi:hypothetical protein